METVLGTWRAVTQDPRVVDFFKGTFERAGVRVTDSGEAFTAIHRGHRVDLEPSVDDTTTDFVVEIDSSQAERFAQAAATGELDRIAQYRVVRALFTPATRATLRTPMLANGVLRRIARIEELIHVTLRSPVPAEEPDATHTLIHVRGQWLVIPGLHGRPGRSFELTTADAVTYQRHVFRGLKRSSWLGWLQFGIWYLRWRPTVSRA
jgi:hypothetical protein